MIKGEKTFRLYHSLFLHFSQKSYNAIDYSFKSDRSFVGFRGFYHLEKLEKKYDFNELIFYFSANILRGITEVKEMNHENYKEFLYEISNMESIFRKDLHFLKKYEKITKRALLSEVLVYNINKLSIIILDSIFNIFNVNKIDNVLLLKILKLKFFVNVDKDYYLQIYHFVMSDVDKTGK